MNAGIKKMDASQEWRSARLLYPLYSALAREFVIETQPSGELETGTEVPSKEGLEQARAWLLEMDSRIQVHQLRQFLQTTTLSNTECLRAMLQHHLQKDKYSDSDRDKIDFLLVQYFSDCAPSRLEDAELTVAYVAKALQTVLGPVDVKIPDWLDLLEDLVQSARASGSLKSLLQSGVLDKGRKLKVSCKEKYFVPVAMVSFTRFSFIMRRVFFRLMHQDLNAILDGLRELESRGVVTLDCSAAQFSAEEPTVRLRMICQSWKVMFHAEYSSGQPLRMLVDLHAIVDDALGASGGLDKKTPATPAPSRAKATSAGATAAAAGFNTSKSETPEFEISGNPSSWNPDGSV
ncbi:MAG TPA: hypothetical protein VGG46_01065 [Terriglobales bacterium]|jgi:hypothetical protein